jgi:hypothetical protein
MIKRVALLVLCALCAAALVALMLSMAVFSAPRLVEPFASDTAPIDDPTLGGRAMELVEQYWGYFYDIAFQDNLVYAMAGQRFYVFSLANPASPVLLGKSSLMLNYSTQIDIDGANAYLADPGISPYTSSPGAGLHVLDVSNPAAPTEIAFYTSYYGSLDVDVFNGYAYISDAGGYLIVVDVSNPAAPLKVKTLKISTDPLSQVQVAPHPVNGKTYAYAISHENENFYAVDISNPLQPELAGSLALPVYWLRDFAVQGARALVVDDDIGNLHLLDLTDPSQLVLVESSNYPPGEKMIYNFDLYGDYLLANELGPRTGLLVMDASGSGLPVEVGFYPGQLKSVIGAQVNGAQIVLMNTGFGFEVVNIANPALPESLSSFAEEGAVNNVRVVGDLVYFSGGQGLRIYRRTGAGTLEYVGGLNVLGDLKLVQDGKAYLGLFEYAYPSPGDPLIRLYVVDVSNPNQPQLLDSLDLQSPVLDVSVYGTYAYLASGGMQIVDISNPAELVVTAVYSDIMSTSYPVSSPLEVAPNPDDPPQLLAYLADPEKGLLIIDVTDPHSITLKLEFKPYELRNPSGLEFIELPGESGKYLAIASQFNESLNLVDITHPFSPALLASAYLACFPHSLTTTPGRVYVACDLDGGRLYLASPTQLDERGHYRIPYKVKDVAVGGEFIYMAAGAEGLFEVWHALSTWMPIPITGGLMTSEYYSLTLEFAADTFTETTEIDLRPRYYGNMPVTFKTIGADYYVELNVLSEDRQPLKPYQVEWQYDPVDFPGIDESRLGLYSWDGMRWVREPSSAVDAAANLVSAAPQHASLWALLAERQGVQEIFLPLLNR